MSSSVISSVHPRYHRRRALDESSRSPLSFTDDSKSSVSSLSSRSVASRWRRRRRDNGSGSPRREPSRQLLILVAAVVALLQFQDRSSVHSTTRPRAESSGNDDEDRRTLRHKSYFASFTHDNSLSAPRPESPAPSNARLAAFNDRSSLDKERSYLSNSHSSSEQANFSNDGQEPLEMNGMSRQEREDAIQFHRMLQEHFHHDESDRVDIPDEMHTDDATPDVPDVLDEIKSASSNHKTSNNTTYSSLVSTSSLPRYTLSSALQQISTYRTAYALLVYDPSTRNFYVLYSRKHIWSSAVSKLLRAMHTLTYLIKLEFATELEEMSKKGHELVIPVSSGDYPLVSDTNCVREKLSGEGNCVGNSDSNGNFNLAPVLHFGSVFRQPIFPNMIAMPPPEAHHLNCFEEWATHSTVCAALRAKSEQDPKGELVYAKEFGIKWKDLKEQVVWRGTDFGYLGFVHPTMKRPSQLDLTFNKIHPNVDNNSEKHRIGKKENTLSVLKEDFDNLVPRWKGVVYTAEAELALEREIEETARGKNEARRMKQRMKPWANIKFSQFIGSEGIKAKTVGSKEYQKWESSDFPAVGESMSLEELALYKYHIDLGGGGGTTWSGTLHKLAFPGLLFHHVTPTMDYFHDWLQPWKHYVPVAANLKDLKDKYDWAQSQPKKAFQIARNGSELMRFLSSTKGMEVRYRRDILDPLRAVIDAYTPLSEGTTHKDITWKEALVDLEGTGNILPILKCTGESITSCEKLVGKEEFLDRTTLRRFTNAGGFQTNKTPPQDTNRHLSPWAHENFVDINKKPDTSSETALFWHIPKSGGTTVKNLYHCTGQTLAHRGGVDPKFGHDTKDELVTFKPKEDKDGKFVNVDTTIREGILRAKELGLVQSHMSDIIFTMEPTFAGQNLYDKKNKGRILALFRHPVDRMVSKFYYLQIADWERGYRPDWKNLSLLEWIEKAELKDDNVIVRKLVQKSFKEPIDETDLMEAKTILRRRVVVGLMNQMEESVHRFNIVLGIDESLDNIRECMNQYFGKSKENSEGVKNSNMHPKIVQNSPEWQLLAKKEWLDLRLYAYAEQLFKEQKETLYSYM